MKCPKCKFVNVDGATECADCGVQFVDIRGGLGYRRPADKIDRACPWNDHGNICGLIGSLSDSTNGSGPWYCSKHWWQLKGYAARTGSAEHVSVRKQWYLDHKQPYEIAPMTGTAHLKSMADPNSDLLQRLDAGQLGHRSREPGEDFDDLMQP